MPTAQPIASAATDGRRRSPAAPPPLPVEQSVPNGRVQPVWMWLVGAGVLAVVAMAVMLPRNRRSFDVKESPSLHRSVAVVRANNSSGPEPAAEVLQPSEEPLPEPDTDPIRSVQSAGVRSTDDPIQASLASVGLVYSPSGNGSGFIAAPNLFVTNFHVIEHDLMSDLRVRFPDNEAVEGRDFPLSIVVEDPRNDIAVLEVDCNVKPLRVAHPYIHTNGQKVVAIGSPGTGGGPILPNFTTDGRLGPQITGPNGVTLWALSIAVNPGNSGGPVIDATRGEVVGVVSAAMTKTQSQGIAVPHPELVRVLEEARKSSKSERQRADALHRQRWCFRQIADRIDDAALVFQKAREAADSGDDKKATERFKTFQEVKKALVEITDQNASLSESTVRQELARISSDAYGDQEVTRALVSLASARDSLLSEVRRSVSHDRVRGYIDAFERESRRARNTVDVLGERLQIDFDWSVPR
jgi:S1-C subfamily serine protease